MITWHQLSSVSEHVYVTGGSGGWTLPLVRCDRWSILRLAELWHCHYHVSKPGVPPSWTGCLWDRDRDIDLTSLARCVTLLRRFVVLYLQFAAVSSVTSNLQVCWLHVWEMERWMRGHRNQDSVLSFRWLWSEEIRSYLNNKHVGVSDLQPHAWAREQGQLQCQQVSMASTACGTTQCLTSVWRISKTRLWTTD